MDIRDKGLRGHYIFPKHFSSIHWLLALILIISLIAGIVAVYVVAREKQNESFKRLNDAVMNCKQITVGHLIITPTKECSEKNRTAVISFNFSSLQIIGVGDEGIRRTWEGR